MPCAHPIPAHRSAFGGVSIARVRDYQSHEVEGWGSQPGQLLLPCGSCLGCEISRARQWAIRCSLEASRHDDVSFVTLTYADEHLPYTLRKADLQGFLKRVRLGLDPLVRIRFFASGEYGEQTYRPHYHLLVFGMREFSPLLEAAWTTDKGQPLGHVREDPVTPQVVSYVAGYCAKKIGWAKEKGRDVVDYATGEILGPYQPPFIQMSRGGRGGYGIAGYARDAYWRSWRDSAIYAGLRVPVPRYLHARWDENASDTERAELELEKLERQMSRVITRDELRAREANAIARQSLKSQRRTKL